MEWLVQAFAADRQQGQAWPWVLAGTPPFLPRCQHGGYLLTLLLHGYRVKELVIQRHGGWKCVFSEWERRINFVQKQNKTPESTGNKLFDSKGWNSQSSVPWVPRGPRDKTPQPNHVYMLSFISWKHFHISVSISYLNSSPCPGRQVSIILYSLS